MLIAQSLRSYSAGTRSFQESLPMGPTRFTATLTRESWPDTGAEIVQLRVDVSFDGGLTWPHFAQAGLRGGVYVSRATGQTLSESTLSFVLPQPENPNRRLRATVTNTATIRTEISVDVS